MSGLVGCIEAVAKDFDDIDPKDIRQGIKSCMQYEGKIQVAESERTADKCAVYGDANTSQDGIFDQKLFSKGLEHSKSLSDEAAGRFLLRSPDLHVHWHPHRRA